MVFCSVQILLQLVIILFIGCVEVLIKLLGRGLLESTVLGCLGWLGFFVFYWENRGYYMAARGYEFYLRVLKVSLTSERSERVRDTFSTRR